MPNGELIIIVETESRMVLSINIKKTFRNFSLDVAFQTNSLTTAILGASGCGKSMTLKCIAGIETPDEGIICLSNRILFDSEKKSNYLRKNAKWVIYYKVMLSFLILQSNKI